MAEHDRTQWTKLVADFESGDLTQREFATERGIPVSHLRYWIYRGGPAPPGGHSVRARVPFAVVGALDLGGRLPGVELDTLRQRTRAPGSPADSDATPRCQIGHRPQRQPKQRRHD